MRNINGGSVEGQLNIFLTGFYNSFEYGGDGKKSLFEYKRW